MEVGGDCPAEAKKRILCQPDFSVASNVRESNFDGIEQNGLAIQSPPIQKMEGPEGYDPSRIPASVFASKSTTPLEWSVASSESLFSLHVGNASFSTEFAQLCKSEEFSKSQEVTSRLFPTEATDGDRRSPDAERGSGVRETSVETTKESSEGHVKAKMPPAEGFRDSPSSLPSEGSVNSTLSFAFPVLEGGDGNSSSVKVGPEKQQHEQQQALPHAPQATQNAAATNWFSCFSCCSLCY